MKGRIPKVVAVPALLAAAVTAPVEAWDTEATTLAASEARTAAMVAASVQATVIDPHSTAYTCPRATPPAALRASKAVLPIQIIRWTLL